MEDESLESSDLVFRALKERKELADLKLVPNVSDDVLSANRNCSRRQSASWRAARKDLSREDFCSEYCSTKDWIS